MSPPIQMSGLALRDRAIHCLCWMLGLGVASADVVIEFGFGPLRDDQGIPVESGVLWAVAAVGPGEPLPGGLSEDSSLGVADIPAARAAFGNATIAPGSEVGGALIVATGQVSSGGFVAALVEWTDEDFEILGEGGKIGLYWFPGVVAGTAVLPESGFIIGGMQESAADPASGGGAGMLVPANSGQTISIAHFDADTTGFPSSLPAARFGAIGVPPSGYQLWRDLTFTLSQIQAGDAEPGADPDGDGVANLIEYATGTPPLQAGGGPLRLSPGGPGVVLGFDQIADPELRYRIEATGDLALAPWPDVVFESSGAGNVEGLVEVGVPLGSGSRFFRLRVDFAGGFE